MQILAAGMLGFVRALVPPTAPPEADTRVPMHATTNMHLDDEAKRLVKATMKQKLQQAQQGQQPGQSQQAQQPDQAQQAQRVQQAQQVQKAQQAQEAQQAAQVQQAREVGQVASVERTHRVDRLEPTQPTGLGGREVQLIQAHYRDRARFAPPPTIPQGWMDAPLPWENPGRL